MKTSKTAYYKRAMAGALTAAVVMSTLVPGVMAAGDAEGHWAQPTLEKWQQKGLLSGDENGDLKPDAKVTRAEVAALTARAFGLAGGNASFSDVAEGAWYHKSVQACAAQGILTDGGSSFRPTGSVNAAQMAVILSNVLKLPADTESADRFSDASSLPSDAKGAIGAVSKAGIMTGAANNYFYPNQELTRAQAVVYLQKALEYKELGKVQPAIGVRSKGILTVDGYQFKDSNGNGQLDVYEDWRKTPEVRAQDLVNKMTLEDKAGMMVINTRGMGINQADKSKTSHDGILDEATGEKTTIFGTLPTYGTTETIESLRMRHFILRENPEPSDMAEWINTMNEVAEATPLGIPVLITSNSRNENGEVTFGMNDASGVYSTWPGTLGLAAAAMGDIAKGGDASLISEFANIARSEWDACGIKKGYMYMADTMTDPRWQRTYGTLGEDPSFIADAISRMVKGFQGIDGLQSNGVALTVKHFPGGGARENGFDPHYAEGQWNVYATEGSLEKYHLPPFQAAIDAGVSSIMPYYAKPSAEKSQTQYDLNGNAIDMEAVGFAFNQAFIQDILRDQMGHQGYINSDSGIIDNMAWGVEELNHPQCAAAAINAGTDIIGDTNNVWAIMDAYNQGLVSEARINEAVQRLLVEQFELGLFENPYRDPQTADEVVATQENWDKAYEAHQKSVVMLKNDNVLPLTDDKLAGKKVYVEYFHQNADTGKTMTDGLRKQIQSDDSAITLTDNYEEADYAILMIDPTSGEYFNATAGLLELSICEDKDVADCVDGIPSLDAFHKETTLAGANRIPTIAEAVHANGGKVISNINFKLAWLVGNIETNSDALLGGFDTYTSATLDVIRGRYNPTGKMPITLPASEEVIAVDQNGECISPNDVPGYDKDQYLPEGMTYAYTDAAGNAYKLGYGLSY